MEFRRFKKRYPSDSIDWTVTGHAYSTIMGAQRFKISASDSKHYIDATEHIEIAMNREEVKRTMKVFQNYLIEYPAPGNTEIKLGSTVLVKATPGKNNRLAEVRGFGEAVGEVRVRFVDGSEEDVLDKHLVPIDLNEL